MAAWEFILQSWKEEKEELVKNTGWNGDDVDPYGGKGSKGSLSPRKNKKHGSCKILETEDLETVKENRQTDPRTKEEEKCPQLDQKEAEL